MPAETTPAPAEALASAETPAATAPAAPAPAAEEPRVFDTYSLVYALTLLFFVPGAIAIQRLPFRDYTFQYVSLVTMPFLLGLIATFLTDSTERLRTRLLRIGVLTPAILLTGVTVLFTASIVVVPISPFIKPQYFSATTPIAASLLVLLASPLVPALLRRFRGPFSAVRLVQGVAIALAIALVAAVVVLSLQPNRELATIARKDVMIYIVGALVWYLPSFGLAAGVWRRLGVI